MMPVKKFRVADRWVGEEYPCLIIAEIGNNHNGDYDLAIRLVDEAIRCKVDAVKFQVKDIETAFAQDLLASPYTGLNSYGVTYREHKQAIEFSHDEYTRIKEYCDKKGIIFFATPFDLISLEFLESIDVPAYKLASFHLTETNFLRQICEKGKPIVVSTGMSSLEEIDAAVQVMDEVETPYALLQCTSSYPTDDKDVHLAVIALFKERYRCVVGYSGHDRGVTIPAASVCFGSSIIEKHFTLDRTLKGTDHAASLEPKGLSALVERTRLLERAMGDSAKRVLECELKNRIKNRGY